MSDISAGWWVLWTVIFIVFVLLMFLRKLPPDKYVALDLFGKPWIEMGPGGLYLVVPGIITPHLFPTKGNQAEWPDNPEQIDKEDNENPAPGKKSPMRIAFVDYAQAKWFKEGETDLRPEKGQSWDEYSKTLSDKEREAIESDPRHQSMNGELQLVTQWRNVHGRIRVKGGTERAVDGELFQFLRVMDGATAEEKVAECNRRLNDIVVAEAQAICGRMTFLHAIAHQEAISHLLQKKAEEEVQEEVILKGDEPDPDKGEHWGIVIDRTYFKSFDPGRRINIDLANAAAAKSRRQATILDAQAEGEAIRLRAEGEAEGIRTKGEAMAASPQAARAAELDAARHVASETELIIATGDQSGGTNILPQVAGMKHILEDRGNKPPADERKKASEKPASVPDKPPLEQVEERFGKPDEEEKK